MVAMNGIRACQDPGRPPPSRPFGAAPFGSPDYAGPPPDMGRPPATEWGPPPVTVCMRQPNYKHSGAGRTHEHRLLDKPLQYKIVEIVKMLCFPEFRIWLPAT
eukprot:5262169-Amphidinium_carterae.1